MKSRLGRLATVLGAAAAAGAGLLSVRMDPADFVRVHRSAIVRIDRVKQLVPLEHGDAMVVLADGTEVRVSRTRRRRVLAVLGLDSDG